MFSAPLVSGGDPSRVAVASRAREGGAQLPECKLKSAVVPGPIKPLPVGAQEGLEVMEKVKCAGFAVLKYVAPLALVVFENVPRSENEKMLSLHEQW